MPVCSYCSQILNSNNELQVHKHRCLPNIIVTYANQIVVVAKEEKGYCCYCAHSSCPKYFATTKGLTSHAKKTHMDWIGPDKASIITTTSSYLYTK
jgi:hypothetical protein